MNKEKDEGGKKKKSENKQEENRTCPFLSPPLLKPSCVSTCVFIYLCFLPLPVVGGDRFL